MGAVTVYRVDPVKRTKEPVGDVIEMREKERMDNHSDLLWMARRLFSLNTADCARISIDGSQARRASPPEQTRSSSAR